MRDIVERLSGYNPPDRTIDDQRAIAVDIHDALAEIVQLRARLRARGTVLEHERDAWLSHNVSLNQRIAALESQLASLQERDAKDAADALTGSMAHRTESMVKLTRRIAARASETPK